MIAEPTADAMSTAATRDAACRMIAMPLAAPASEVAPTCPASRANWIESVTPIGRVTKMTGITAVAAWKAPCLTNSCH